MPSIVYIKKKTPLELITPAEGNPWIPSPTDLLLLLLWTASVVWWSEFLATERRCIVFPVRYEQNLYMRMKVDRIYGLVVRVPGYRSRGPGSIPGANRFSEK
jgi:hypothetical protein